MFPTEFFVVLVVGGSGRRMYWKAATWTPRRRLEHINPL